ncbi:MAG TPA: S-adenosylmethionine:tRNA ribosyltransferase-isomerase [Acidimicrobiales bacterium]|nr:S-adenosylmethionine:tRNA ribosyltransferase-isomerase [Acidimicrobiales bacterium]
MPAASEEEAEEAEEAGEAGLARPSGPVPMDAYDYGLPADAIAQQPVEPRSAARLLVSSRVSSSGTMEHATVSDLPTLLRAGDVVVVNDTRVLAARLPLVKVTGGGAEVLLLEPIDVAGSRWEALVRPGRRLPPGTRLHERAPGSPEGRPGPPPLGPPVVEIGKPVAGGDDSRRSVRLIDPTVIERAGLMPLPPYIHRRLDDPERYQTVYAADLDPGDRSTAAPTAGLHFTAELLDACRRAGAEVVTVDLAIGLDTFRPITAPTPAGHVIHRERYRVPAATLDACARAERVVAVGTTVVRALESAASTGRLSGRTDLFIYGEHTFRAVDLLVTNFHLPRSSLLLMVEAFCGQEWRQLYASALAEGYRFLSFGDAMVVARAGPKGRPVARLEPGR